MSFVPVRYLPKRLTKKDKQLYSEQLRKSRKQYKKGKYHTRKRIKSFKTKPSKHVTVAKKIYSIDKISASPLLAKKTGCSIKTLKKIVKKGQGAYFSSGSRPNQTGHSWGRARLASSISGGKAALSDYSILKEGCTVHSKALRLAKTVRKKYKHTTPKTKLTSL